MGTLKISLQTFSTALILASCGINSVDPMYTPTGGEVFVADDSLAYSAAVNAGGDGWVDGYYSMGYGDAGKGSFCLGAACFCPTGWTAGEFKASMLLTAATASGALSSSGRSSLDTENEIYVNSSSSSAVSSGSNSRLTAPDFFLVGNYVGTLYGSVHLGQSPLSDPLAFLPDPSTTDLITRSSSLLSISSAATLQPGIYNGGIALSSGAQVILKPGLYYIVNGGFSVGSHSTVVGSEVTIFLADAATSTLSIQGGASASLTPPTDGYTRGLTIFFNRNNASTVTITGGGNLKIYGSIYTKSATVNLGGNGSMVAGSQIVASKVTVGGNGTSTITTAGGIYALPSGCFAP